MASSIARRGRWYTERAYPYYFRPGPETYRYYYWDFTKDSTIRGVIPDSLKYC